MNILWLNLRKRGRAQAVVATLERIIVETNSKLVFLQETFAGTQSGQLRIAGMRQVYISTDLCVLCSTSLPDVEVCVTDPFFLLVRLGRAIFGNVHLSAYHTSARQEQLCRLAEILRDKPNMSAAIGGDFNLAPRRSDGSFNGTVSTWTSESERATFSKLLTQNDLWDVLADEAKQDFSIERQFRTGLIQFRCDLILCSNALRSKICASYLHETRRGSWAFTDHSGMILRISGSHENRAAISI